MRAVNAVPAPSCVTAAARIVDDERCSTLALMGPQHDLWHQVRTSKELISASYSALEMAREQFYLICKGELIQAQAWVQILRLVLSSRASRVCCSQATGPGPCLTLPYVATGATELLASDCSARGTVMTRFCGDAVGVRGRPKNFATGKERRRDMEVPRLTPAGCSRVSR